MTREVLRNVERGDFSIAAMREWDFWAAPGAVSIPENVSPDTAHQIVVMRAIALRDMPMPSERRS